MSRRQVKSWEGHSAAELRKRWGRKEVYLYGKIDSTMAAASDLAEEGVPDGTLVLCREQTEGQGRHGRTWHSPAGMGVYLSMIFRPEDQPVLPIASLLAGLGVVRALDRSLEGVHPALKWPNDVMADDRKMGGVLARTSGGSHPPRHLVVGAGINVKDPRPSLPKALRARATWVREHAPDAEFIEVADAVVEGFEERARRPASTLDPATLDLLDRYDWLKSRRVRVRQGEEEEGLPGVCVGIAPDGALLFRPDRGALRRLSSAVVEPEQA